MPRYTLSYEDDRLGCTRRIEFEAVDPGAALIVAQKIEPGKSAVLWEGEKQLCRLQRRPIALSSDIWVIEPVEAGT